MYKYVLNSVVKISLMFAQYFEYYAIILRMAVFWGHAVYFTLLGHSVESDCRLYTAFCTSLTTPSHWQFTAQTRETHANGRKTIFLSRNFAN